VYNTKHIGWDLCEWNLSHESRPYILFCVQIIQYYCARVIFLFLKVFQSLFFVVWWLLEYTADQGLWNGPQSGLQAPENWTAWNLGPNRYLTEWWTTRLRKALVYQTQGPKMPDTPPATNGIQSLICCIVYTTWTDSPILCINHTVLDASTCINQVIFKIIIKF
jgi:hypothetical protein